jgi:hypothetical protein
MGVLRAGSGWGGMDYGGKLVRAIRNKSLKNNLHVNTIMGDILKRETKITLLYPHLS